jgi:hypothetical protein
LNLPNRTQDLTSLPSGGIGGLRNAPPLGQSAPPAKKGGGGGGGFGDIDSMFDDPKPEKTKAVKKGKKGKVREKTN